MTYYTYFRGGITAEYAIVLKDVVKRFGKTVALNRLDLTVRAGEVHGLIGPNGSGKTTTMRIISGIIKKFEGRAEVLGYQLPAERNKLKGLVAYLPEDLRLYGRLTGWENILYFAMLYSETRKEAEIMARYGADIAGLSERDLVRRASEYSKGMARRVALARTLMTKSPLTILDEPTSGLDVFSAYRMRESIKRFARETGSTVVISSHNMLEVQNLCDSVTLILKGRAVASGSPKEIIESAGATDLEEAFVKLASGDEVE
jgi:ABC-2 type transport system ATP-binding protein